MNPTFKATARKLYDSLKARHRGGNAVKYGPIPITRKQFSEWLLERSMSGEGYCWKCEYTGNVLQVLSRTQAGRLTVDHRVPLTHGGTSDLNNLAVCSEEANRIKGDMSIGCYSRLMTTLHPEHPSDRESVLKRLKGYNPSWRKRG